mmetsp:Transcript_12104/g.52026  ORF Transcript_12104/g.52026 Transcript_12104/m.52026 type:complete len:394 (-) Transcript_12104:995-2176(-)
MTSRMATPAPSPMRSARAVNCAASSALSARITASASARSATATAYVTNAWCSCESNAGVFPPHIAATVGRFSSCLSLAAATRETTLANLCSLVKPCTAKESAVHVWLPMYSFVAAPAGTETVPFRKQSSASPSTARSAASAAHAPSTPTATSECAGIASAPSKTNRERTNATSSATTPVSPCARAISAIAGNRRSRRSTTCSSDATKGTWNVAQTSRAFSASTVFVVPDPVPFAGAPIAADDDAERGSFQMASVRVSVTSASTCSASSSNADRGSFLIFTSRRSERPPIAAERCFCAAGSLNRAITAARRALSATDTAYVRRAWCRANCTTGARPPVIASVVLNSASEAYRLRSTRATRSMKSLWSLSPVTMNTTTSPSTSADADGRERSSKV